MVLGVYPRQEAWAVTFTHPPPTEHKKGANKVFQNQFVLCGAKFFSDKFEAFVVGFGRAGGIAARRLRRSEQILRLFIRKDVSLVDGCVLCDDDDVYVIILPKHGRNNYLFD
jgi:hypothetical protein